MSIKYSKTYIKDFNALEKERKHIILLDGTWNDENGVNLDGQVTNIANLHNIFINEENEQIVRYHRGVGNDNDNAWPGTLWKGATGKGVVEIVEAAYLRFVQDWKKGDKIFILGFSRGAATARLLANKIYKEGVPKSVTITLEPKENKETKAVEQRISHYKIDKKEHLPVDITFMGVWDTVSAFGLLNVFERFLGIKRKDLFTNHHIAPNVKRAVHLVAIDETRNPFAPSLMNYKEGITHEVWFPGVHSDLGGGYEQDEIAKVTLHYMIKMMKEWACKETMKPFIINEQNYQAHTLIATRKAHFHFHGDAIGEDLRKIGVQVDGKIDPSIKPKIHKLYFDLCESPKTMAVVIKRKTTKSIKFQYMPFNVKVLEGNFEIIE